MTLEIRMLDAGDNALFDGVAPGAESGLSSGRAMLTKWQNDLRTVPGAKIVELPGASLYMFLANEIEIIRGLRSFSASLPR